MFLHSQIFCSWRLPPLICFLQQVVVRVQQPVVNMGASSFVWQFSRTSAPSVIPAVAQFKTGVVMLGHSARMISKATGNQRVVLWGAVHLSNRFCARSPRRDTFGQVSLGFSARLLARRSRKIQIPHNNWSFGIYWGFGIWNFLPTKHSWACKKVQNFNDNTITS